MLLPVLLAALLALLAPPAGAVAFPPDCRIPRATLTAGSLAVGTPSRGRLVRGVLFPAETPDAFTWNLPGRFGPNPAFRRWGTEKLVLTLECVFARYRSRRPEAARVGVADLSLPRGGRFGRRYGGLGHASHRNGRDADVLYPRIDGCECPAEDPEEVDTIRAQELIEAFVRAGAQYVFVSPVLYERLLLWGPRGVVIPLRHHDSHMHVRIRR
ncbi:MAG TPA: penicillin-insensitive murein endopeptidase [Solirubrobacteraceae bacterium]|nr:penicillin-insensitive murein endopeptidase [Solirubrobacteraceae bacterium]